MSISQVSFVKKGHKMCWHQLPTARQSAEIKVDQRSSSLSAAAALGGGQSSSTIRVSPVTINSSLSQWLPQAAGISRLMLVLLWSCPGASLGIPSPAKHPPLGENREDWIAIQLMHHQMTQAITLKENPFYPNALFRSKMFLNQIYFPSTTRSGAPTQIPDTVQAQAGGWWRRRVDPGVKDQDQSSVCL